MKLATRHRRPANPAKPVTLAVLALGFAATLRGSLPGYLTYDSVMQLADGRAGRYHLWHPPVMAWLLGLADSAHRGTSLFVAGEIMVLFAALAAVVAIRPRVSWLAVPMAVLFAASPLLVVYQGEVWKDVLFADAVVGGFLLLSVSARVEGLARGALVLAALALLTLAALTRQNGAVALLAAAAALVVMALRRDGRRMLVPAIAGAAVALFATLAVAVAAQAWFTAREAQDDPALSEEVRTIQLYDIVGALSHDPTVELKSFGAQAATVRGALAAYTPTRVDTIADLPEIDAVTTQPHPIPEVWRDVVLHHTRAYLAHRADVFTWLFATPKLALCLPTAVGVDGPPDLLRALKLAPRFDAHDAAMGAYAARFYATPVFSHLAYALLAVVLAFIALRSRDPADTPIGFMLLGVGAFAASFALIGLACDHRYLYALDLSAMAAALHLACSGTLVKRRP